MAKQKTENGIESAQTHEWLTMSEAADRVGKSQATIRTALHKHSAFISGENWREIKPVLIMPDGTQKPGSGRGNILVRADALDTWAMSTPERVHGRRVAGTIYKINVRDVQLDDTAITDAHNAAGNLATGMTIEQAIAALLAPFDVNMRKANVRKPQDESSTEYPDLPNADAPHASELFEVELIEG